MALFQGEDLVDFTTPDGRQMRLPRSAVPSSLMPQQQQLGLAPIGVTDEVAGSPGVQEVPSVTGGPAAYLAEPGYVESRNAYDAVHGTSPTAEELAARGGAPVQNQPDYNAGTIDMAQLARQRAEQQRAADKQAKAAAAVAASPQGVRAAADNGVQAAMGGTKTAVDNAANVDAAAQDLLGQASEGHNARLDKLFDDRARAANERFEAEQAKVEEIGNLRKKISSTKIDRSADHPILAAISIALAGLGSAMKGESTNPGLEMFWKALDRKVANQMGDLDLMEKTYGLAKDELAAYKDMSGRKLEVYNGMIAGEADKAKRHLEEIIAKSASEKTRANAKILMAQIDERAADAHQKAVQWGMEYDQRDKHQQQQMNVSWYNAKEGARHNAAAEQLQRENMYLDYNQALANTKATGDQATYKAQLEMVKDNEERGIRGVDGNFLMTKEGQAKMAQAAQIEEQAAKLEQQGKADPMGFSVSGGKDKVEAMRQQASQMRGDARINDVVRHRDKTQAGKFSDGFAAAQTVVTQIDNIKSLYKDHGRDFIYTDEGRAQLQAAFSALAPTLKEAWQLGAWDKGSAGLVEKIIGGDPSAWSTVITKMEAPEAFLGRLETVVQNLETGVQNQLSRNAGWTGKVEDLFGRKTAPETTPIGKASADLSKGQTPLEAEKGAAPTTAGKIRDQIYSFGGLIGAPQYKVNIEAAQNSASLKYPALGKDQEKPFDTLLTAYNNNNAKAGQELVAKVINSADGSPDLAIAMMKTMREHAPKLYEQALTSIKSGPVADALDTVDKNQIAVSTIATPMLIQQGRTVGWADDTIKAELTRRALGYTDPTTKRAVPKDPAAARALVEILETKQRDTLPKASIFREGR